MSVKVIANIQKPVSPTFTIEVDEETAQALFALTAATSAGEFIGIAELFFQFKALLGTKNVGVRCRRDYITLIRGN